MRWNQLFRFFLKKNPGLPALSDNTKKVLNHNLLLKALRETLKYQYGGKYNN